MACFGKSGYLKKSFGLVPVRFGSIQLHVCARMKSRALERMCELKVGKSWTGMEGERTVGGAKTCVS